MPPDAPAQLLTGSRHEYRSTWDGGAAGSIAIFIHGDGPQAQGQLLAKSCHHR
jgi:hypothetical protein